MPNKSKKHPVPLPRSRLPQRHTLVQALALIGCLTLPVGHVMAAIPTAWKNTAYAYEARTSPLQEVLADFSHTFGVQLEVDGLLEGTVNGRLRSETPQALLDRLGLEHRFQWFLYSNTLYISALDQQQSVRLAVSDDSISDLKEALTNIGLLDERFGWGALPEEGVVLVSGPMRYVELIKRFSRKRKTEEEKQDVMAFPLSYANATDRQIDYRGEKLLVPGVASILRGLLETRSSSTLPGGITPPGLINGAQLSAPGTGDLAALSSMSTLLNNERPPASKDKTGGASKIRVEADIRNNAVLIYDSPRRLALYETLIAKLDVARKLVEIDAIILDIDRTHLTELGLNWGFHNRRGGVGIENLAPGTSSTLRIDNYDGFSAELRALEARGIATIVSSPSILTLENYPAVIDFNRTQYITAKGERFANILPVTAGTSFQVVPRVISANGAPQIHLVVDIEDGNFVESKLNSESLDVRRGKVSTQAVIGEKRSLVIGGFHVGETSDQVRKIPLLGDIPLIGKALFSSSERRNNRRERLFILTPRLIGDQTNPVRYLPKEDQPAVDAAMAPLERLNAEHNPLIRQSDVAATLSKLVTGKVPKGFTRGPLPFKPETLCTPRKTLQVDPVNGQWYKGANYNVAVVVLRNVHDRRVRIDENECNGPLSLGISIWPKPWLEPGEQAEVFVAMRPFADTQSADARPSMLTPDRKTAQ